MKTMLTFTSLALVGIMAVVSPARAQQTKDIVDTAVAAGSFTTLAKALTAADLVATLKGPGPFTVFAPTDEAFAKLPAGTLENLLKPENKAMLRRVLTYHVVPGKVMAADVVKVSSAKAVSGDTLSIKASGGTVMVDKARVVKTDIAASNGVIHVVDAVLLPPGGIGRSTMAAMVLLTGASGYIGSRLLRVLEEGGCAVRCLARQPERVAAGRATTEVVAGDCLDEASLVAAMDGVDQAYYLVHSMASGPGFAALDRAGRRQLRPRRRPRRRAPHHLSRRTRRRSGFPVDTSEEPPGNGRGTARRRRTGRRVPRLDRHWRRQPVVRDDPRAGRAAAGDDLPADGSTRAPSPSRLTMCWRICGRRSTCRTGARACSKSADPRWSPTAR